MYDELEEKGMQTWCTSEWIRTANTVQKLGVQSLPVNN
jgi:hypothetical protein